VTQSNDRQFSCGAEAIPHPLGADVASDDTIRVASGSSVWKPVVVSVLVLIGFLVGWQPAFVAAIGAVALLISREVDPKRLYEEVDWGLLLFFAGLFLILGGAGAAGVTQRLLALAQRMNLQNSFIFGALVSGLSNIVSNVPAVMLLRPAIAQFQDQHTAWLLLSMASTLAGNLTITGSVANIIVAEKARPDVHISFTQYLRIGVPVTVFTLVAGLLWLKFVHY
jgi:Na+/H+ antiporter NhaD/arsenite permease-like protein